MVAFRSFMRRFGEWSRSAVRSASDRWWRAGGGCRACGHFAGVARGAAPRRHGAPHQRRQPRGLPHQLLRAGESPPRRAAPPAPPFDARDADSARPRAPRQPRGRVLAPRPFAHPRIPAFLHSRRKTRPKTNGVGGDFHRARPTRLRPPCPVPRCVPRAISGPPLGSEASASAVPKTAVIFRSRLRHFICKHSCQPHDAAPPLFESPRLTYAFSRHRRLLFLVRDTESSRRAERPPCSSVLPKPCDVPFG